MWSDFFVLFLWFQAENTTQIVDIAFEMCVHTINYIFTLHGYNVTKAKRYTRSQYVGWHTYLIASSNLHDYMYILFSCSTLHKHAFNIWFNPFVRNKTNYTQQSNISIQNVMNFIDSMVHSMSAKDPIEIRFVIITVGDDD